MAFGYPVSLELRGRRCVVVGETAIHEGKVEALLAAGADDVIVVGAAATRAGRPTVRVVPRAWRPSDLDGAFLVVASSDDPGERAAIADEARARGALVNVMDDITNCDWAAPSVVRRGDLVIAISTGGGSPALARAIREELEEAFDSGWADVLRTIREVREDAIAAVPEVGERSRRWRAALNVREVRELSRDGRLEELSDRLGARVLREWPT